MKKSILKLCTLLSVLFTTGAFGQNQKETVEKSLTDYFKLERENIHVQLDKSVFTTNEQAWFKGYVFNRKMNSPFLATVNVIASLMDESGKVLETQLVYCNQGTFQGSFSLNEKLASGHYYMQFYTNWMNNFAEDESFVSHITVINLASGAGNALMPADPSKMNISINPEGGSLVVGVTNIVGIHVTDCNGESANVTSADLVDQSGTVLKKLQLNKLGFGRFDITPKEGNSYKIVVNNENSSKEALLPPALATGVAMEVNSFTIPDKTLVTLRINKAQLSKYSSLLLVVHKDDKNNIYDIKPNNATETKIAIANTDLQDGVNTFRLLDENLNEIAERIVYKYPSETLSSDLTRPGDRQTLGRTDYKGKINHQGMFNLSISVLPENSICVDNETDIYSSILLLPYLQDQHSASGKHYFSTLSKGKAYELDLYLLSQKSKYKWENIKNTPPEERYTFDRGLVLKGTVPQQMVNTNAKVRLFTITGIDLTSPMDEKGHFSFENLVLTDSLHINLSVINKGVQPKTLNQRPLLTNGIKAFNKMYKPTPRCYISGANTIDLASGELPVFSKGSITLDETVIEKTRLKYARSLGNNNLQGHKVDDSDANIYRNITQYIISRGGFRVEQGGIGNTEVHIYSRSGRSSINGGQSEPIIYLNNMQLLDHNQLNLIYMDEVDEIYMSSTAIVPSIRNYSGIIKIYLRPNIRKGKAKDNTPDIIVTGAYKKIQPFENIPYTSTIDKGFENFGILDWNTQVMSDEKGEFTFSIPNNMGQKSVKLLIEGFSADGKLISETKTLQLK
nr:hypothetical protein [uncultured Flavobacterium sp.]